LQTKLRISSYPIVPS